MSEARTTIGLTLRQVAEQTGMSNGYLSLIEHGRVGAPSPTYLLALAERYSLPYVRLMELAGHPAATISRHEPDFGRGALPAEGFGAQRWNASHVFSANARRSMLQVEEPQLAVEFRSLANEIETLSLDDIVRVRAFVSGLRAARV